MNALRKDFHQRRYEVWCEMVGEAGFSDEGRMVEWYSTILREKRMKQWDLYFVAKGYVEM